MDFRGEKSDSWDWLAQSRIEWLGLVNTVINLRFHKMREIS
jgi:hypothetical protein